MSAPTVLVMAKAPRPGSVKTRLHPMLGPDRCARLQARLIEHTIGVTRGLGVRTVVAFDPPDAADEMGAAGIELVPQRGMHLGERMTAAAHDALPGGGPLAVIGTDAPTLTAEVIREAFAALDRGSTVLGPAVDGGYYLLGVRWPLPAAFAIDPELWSGPQVLAATAARLRRTGRVELLPELRDLDTPADARALLADPALPPAIAAILDEAGVSV